MTLVSSKLLLCWVHVCISYDLFFRSCDRFLSSPDRGDCDISWNSFYFWSDSPVALTFLPGFTPGLLSLARSRAWLILGGPVLADKPKLASPVSFLVDFDSRKASSCRTAETFGSCGALELYYPLLDTDS